MPQKIKEEPGTKRQRAVRACARCKKRKSKCDPTGDGKSCEQCLEAHVEDSCSFTMVGEEEVYGFLQKMKHQGYDGFSDPTDQYRRKGNTPKTPSPLALNSSDTGGAPGFTPFSGGREHDADIHRHSVPRQAVMIPAATPSTSNGWHSQQSTPMHTTPATRAGSYVSSHSSFSSSNNTSDSFEDSVRLQPLQMSQFGPPVSAMRQTLPPIATTVPMTPFTPTTPSTISAARPSGAHYFDTPLTGSSTPRSFAPAYAPLSPTSYLTSPANYRLSNGQAYTPSSAGGLSQSPFYTTSHASSTVPSREHHQLSPMVMGPPPSSTFTAVNSPPRYQLPSVHSLTSPTFHQHQHQDSRVSYVDTPMPQSMHPGYSSPPSPPPAYGRVQNAGAGYAQPLLFGTPPQQPDAKKVYPSSGSTGSGKGVKGTKATSRVGSSTANVGGKAKGEKKLKRSPS